MKKLCLLTIVLVFALIGCQVNQFSEPSVIASSRPATATSPIATGLATLTKDIGSSSITRCLNLLKGPSEGVSFSGRLIIESDDPHTVYLFNLESKTQTLFDDSQVTNIQVSPDRNWIAYIKDDSATANEWLMVQSGDGSKSYKFPTRSEEWQSISHWLSNEVLVLWNHTVPLDNIVLFSPFTGSKEFMPNEYPDILPVDDDWDFYWPSITIYSPSLTELLYVAKEGDSFKPGYSKLVLWNIEDKQAVTEVMEFGYSIVPPVWNSKGDGALFVKSVEGYDPPVAHDELFFLSSAGEIRQLTHLIDNFEYARILNYSLSPDEKYLAMVLETRLLEGRELERKLLILDMLSLQVKDLCLSPDRFTPLIWSPDEYKLTMSQSLQTGNLRTIVVDTINESGFEIVENFRPRGWLR